MKDAANLPDVMEPKSNILYSDIQYDTLNWKGERELQSSITVRPKRTLQDAYTNSYCKAISASKCPCNSNIQVTTGARPAIYCSCYAAKRTQKEDTGELKKMGSYVAHRFLEEHKDNTLFEGFSRLMGTVIVGTSEHVVAAPMAAYLVRNQSRFRWSHKFKYIPVKEVVELIQRTTIDSLNMSVLQHDSGCFLTSEALHYLQCPKKNFEHYCLIDFFQEYEIVRSDKPSETNEAEGTYTTIDDNAHPGYNKQIIKKQKEPVLAQFSHWAFPDASSFGGDILQMSQYPMNTSVENYCQTILVLYHPFRSLDDITIDGSFHKMFKRVYHTGVPCHIRELLSNVQMFYNSVRMLPKEDPILNCTERFHSPGSTDLQDQDSDAEDDDNFFDGVFDLLSPQRQQQAQASNSGVVQGNISLQNLRKAGARGCCFSIYHQLSPRPLP
ncbi:hypothetical protein SEMRO_2179_G317910.1 [Seminavis robusta]|uniref:Uncharacterized protein n=1 Tax=Seminavis robusta TaxID=568900 RepID=A0A9N8EWV7_9STRA|nr:hypothetical protein SEMRO_2179_G317910.1 [Seminavis robusta]|eukprot:Sro2179_g317910.1 n/a (440) ;mRNA; r:1211-2530